MADESTFSYFGSEIAGVFLPDVYQDENGFKVGPTLNEPQQPVLLQPQLRDQRFLEPSNNPGTTVSGSGTQVHYEITLEGDQPLGEPVLEISLSAATGGTGATYARFCDYIGVCLWDRVEFHTTSQLSHTIYRDYWLWRLRRLNDDFERDRLQRLVAGELSPAERNTRAAAAQVVHYPVPIYWAYDKGKAPVLSGMSEKLTLRFISVTGADRVVQHDGATAASFTFTTQLLMDYNHLLEGEKEYQIASVRRGDAGRMHMFDYVQTTPDIAIAAGGTTATIELRDFTLAAKTIVMQLIPAANDVDKAVSYTDYATTDLSNLEWECKAAGTQIWRRQKVDLRNLYYADRFKGSVSPVPEYSFAELPCHENAQSGFMPMNMPANAKIYLYKTNATTWSANLVARVFTVNHNYMVESQGRLKATFV